MTLRSVVGMAEYLSLIREIRDKWNADADISTKADGVSVWFRGQRDARWGLKPKLFRPEFREAGEADIRQEFQSRGMQMIQGRLPSTKWEWYFLMQHYGSPTRLLDWTSSPLIALFFALSEHPEDCDAAVWLLDPWWLNRRLRKGVDGPMEADWSEAQPYLAEIEAAFAGQGFGPSSPAAIEPPHVDRRLAVQQSRFVIFGRTQDLAKTKGAKEPARTRRLEKILIPATAIGEIQAELENAGLTISAIFPDLEHLSMELCDRWKLLRKR